MRGQLHRSTNDFHGGAVSVYHADPVLFTLELSTLATSGPGGRALLSVWDGDVVVGAAVQGHKSVLLVSGLPPDTAPVAADTLAEAGVPLAGVRGTPSTAAAFATGWTAASGSNLAPVDREVLYRLRDLRPPTGVPGAARLSERPDAPTVVRWLDAFFIEAFGELSDVNTSAALLDSITAAGHPVVLWVVAGEPVSMARVHTPVRGVGRIGPVYTPPAHRGHGYGAAITAAAARAAQRGGADAVMLFADGDNPTANHIYRRIGFEPVAENVRYAVRSG